MGIVDDISEDWHAACAALAWQVDLGISDGVGDLAVNRYEMAAALRPAATMEAAAAAAEAVPGPVPVSAHGQTAGDGAVLMMAVAAATAAAGAAGDLAALRAALDGYTHCTLRQGARNLVFAEGAPGVAVLVLGPAPGREEDLEGRVFAGLAGVLFDRMFAAIGLGRGNKAAGGGEAAGGVYLCPVMPWRPASDRAPDAAEIAMMRPFVARHIALARPRLVVAMGNAAAAMLLGPAGEAGIGIGRLRGRWHAALDVPVLPMFDPAHLLRNPAAKRDAWADLLELQARLHGLP